MTLPGKMQETYNQRLRGVYGEFGAGDGKQIIYLQGNISPERLKKVVHLINEIPGSERWGIRDLFQREVDEERVTNSLIPYFMDGNKVKFFNPITLTLLPSSDEAGGFQIKKELLNVEFSEKDEEDSDGFNRFAEGKGYFRFKYRNEDSKPDIGRYAELEWNSDNTRVVAVDGQHRLSALKRIYDDSRRSDTIKDWLIPVVVLAVVPERAQVKGKMLEVVRNIFIYINKEAKPPNEARQILLDDQCVNEICTQEILEYSHENVVKEGGLNPEKVPLLFYDWRGQESGEEKERSSFVALQSVVEVRDWLGHYILGENFSHEQVSMLNIEPDDTDLFAVLAEKAGSSRRGRRGSRRRKQGRQYSLTEEQTKDIRERVRKYVLPGVVTVLEKFEPYKAYIQKLREIEHKHCDDSDIGKNAFDWIRFGPTSAWGEDVQLRDKIIEKIGEIQKEIEDAKGLLPPMLLHLIGMRGIMFAYGSLYEKCQDKIGDVPFVDYSIWFVDTLNKAWNEKKLSKLFAYDPDKDKVERKLSGVQRCLEHIILDQNRSIINYRLGQAEAALGALVALVVLSLDESKIGDWGEYLDNLESTLTKSYRKVVRAEWRNEDKAFSKDELEEEVRKRAERKLGEIKRHFSLPEPQEDGEY